MGGPAQREFNSQETLKSTAAFSERSSLEALHAQHGHISEEVAEVLAARAASKNLHFSRSVSIVAVRRLQGAGERGGKPFGQRCTPVCPAS